MSLLGIGDYRVLIVRRGGTPTIGELPYTSLSFGRALDDISGASCEVAAADCDTLTEDLTCWKHELAVWRDDVLVWVGPIVDLSFDATTVTIAARDLFEWFERRFLPVDRNFVAIDLTTIFTTYVTDALSADTSPAITVSSAAAGVTGSRNVVAVDRRRAADELRELARSGVDFTMIGRTLRVGPEIPNAGDLRIWDDHADQTALHIAGLDAASSVTVKGATGGTAADQAYGPSAVAVVAAFGGVDPDIGLIEVLYDEQQIRDTASALAAAASRLLFLTPAPQYIDLVLRPEWTYGFGDLVPGAVVETALTFPGREVVGTMRLASVAVQVGGGETVGVQLEPLGTAQ